MPAERRLSGVRPCQAFTNTKDAPNREAHSKNYGRNDCQRNKRMQAGADKTGDFKGDWETKAGDNCYRGEIVNPPSPKP